MHKLDELAEVDRQLEQHELDKTRLKLISETPKLTARARLPSPSHQPGPTPEPTKTQPQGKFSVKSILSAPWSAEDTTTTAIATHLDALHRAAAHTVTREATSKAMNFLFGHVRDSHDSSSCPPCMVMRAELEQQQPKRMQPFRQATARATTPCLATLVELCNNVIESKTANPHSKRRACLTNASASTSRTKELSKCPLSQTPSWAPSSAS